MRFPQVVVVLGSVLVGAAVVSPGAGAGLVTRQDKRDARYLISGNGFIDVAVAAADGRGMEIKHKFKAEGNPSWVLFDKKTNTVFSVDENNAQVQRHTIDLDAPNIQLTKSANSSSGPVHLALLDDRNRLLSASFTNGTVDVWDVAGDDLKLVKTVALRGNLGPNKERQASHHAHQVIPEPVGRFVAVTDLGTDIITMIDTKDDNFNIISETTIDEAGCGPRHGAFFPPGQGPATHLMVLCEMKNSIHVLPLERSGDRLGLLKGLKIPSFGSRSQNASSAAGEIVISPDGSFVYVINRLTTEQTDHIARFTVKRSVGAGAANGATNGAAKDPCPRSVATAGGGGSESSAITLEFSDEFSTQGKAPRMMSFGLDGKQMFVNSNGAIGMLGLDIAADGSLTPVEESSLAYSIFSSKPDSGPQFVQQIR